jgi:myo-inositol-1-phosphate synthase
LTLNDSYYARLKDSLKRWSSVTIEFNGTFYDGKKYISMIFHILDSAKIREEDKMIELEFNSDFLLKIKESQFFKYINFDYYKALKRPVSRRLFEILCKTFKGRESWEIDLVKLGTKLTLFKRKISTRQGEKEVMYHSDVLVALKPAINEINKVAENKELFKSLEIPASEAFSLEYHLKKENKIIVFSKRTPDWVKQEKSPEMRQEAQIKVQREVKEAPPLKQLYEMSKSLTSSVKEAIKSYYNEKGFEYVKSNILYANEKATKNYGAYLKKCLKEDWGVEVREQESKREESEKALQEKKAKEKQEVKKTYEKLEELKRAYDALEQEEISRLEPLALEKCVALGMPRNFIPKITLMEKIVELHQEQNQSKSGKKTKIKAR